MTNREMMDGFYRSLMEDERILSARERELLTRILLRARANCDVKDEEVQSVVSCAVGDIVAQRAYEVLGESITRRLLESPAPFYSHGADAEFNGGRGLRNHASESRTSGTHWPPPKGPGPPTPGPPSS